MSIDQSTASTEDPIKELKPIKITEANAGKITEALASANGSKRNRTVDADAVEVLAGLLEARLEAAGIFKKDRPGAVGLSEMGSVSSSYGPAPEGVRVRIERRSAGWYLVGAGRVKAWGQGAELTVSNSLRAQVVANLLRGLGLEFNA